MRRRSFMAGAAATALLRPPATLAETAPTLLDEARRRAARPFAEIPPSLPPPFAGLSYDAYRGIRPIPARSAMLQNGPDFAFDLLPPGLFFPDPVKIDRGSAGDGAKEIAFAPDLFEFDERYFDEIPKTAPGAGFSGLRLRHPLNAPDRMDEVLVLQGASYFRAVGQAMVYGLSARAAALGTGGPAPEEFPRFTHLRLHPAQGGAARIEALIDSPSLAGHFDMTLRPGKDTVTDVAVTLLPRREITDIGVAPLTSMHLKGPLRAPVDDFRPRVHDSDLLLIENGAGERLWRPISNPSRVETSAFLDDDPVSFGLHQTPRAFVDFEDTEARYHDRPSAIVRPAGNWGRGAVILVEIPTADEFMDNVVAFWRPEAPLAPGSEHRFAYSIIWTRGAPDAEDHRAIVQSRSGREHERPGVRRYVIDISGPPERLVPEITGPTSAVIEGVSVFALPGGGTRLTFLLTPGPLDAADIRVVLREDDGHAAAPVWLHRWTRARDGGV